MRTLHISVDVRGALKASDATLKDYCGCFKVDGKPLNTVMDLRAALIDALEDGYEFIPSASCPCFDKKRGCQCYLKEMDTEE